MDGRTHTPKALLHALETDREDSPLFYATNNALLDKLDSDALPMPNFTKAERREPRTETEALLVETFASVLALDRVGIDDDFFDLGGHSLLVTRLVALLKNRFDVEVTVMDLFDAPSASSLAQRIEQKQVIGRLVESDVEGADYDREEMAL